jgi:hypothetical protein
MYTTWTSHTQILLPVLYTWRTLIFRFGHNIWRSKDIESKLISLQLNEAACMLASNEALHATVPFSPTSDEIETAPTPLG